MPDRIRYANPTAGFNPTDAEVERKRFYNSAAWRRLRAMFLKAHPLCERCMIAGKGPVEATTVHHREERLLRPDLAMTTANLEGLCGSCHAEHHTTQRRMKLQTQSRVEPS